MMMAAMAAAIARPLHRMSAPHTARRKPRVAGNRCSALTAAARWQTYSIGWGARRESGGEGIRGRAKSTRGATDATGHAERRRPHWQSGAAQNLLQGGEIQVGRQFRDEGRAAPVGAQAVRIDRARTARVERRGVVSGEGVTVALGQVGVVVAEVQ